MLSRSGSFHRGCYLLFTKGLFLRSFSITRSDVRGIFERAMFHGKWSLCRCWLGLSGEGVTVCRAKCHRSIALRLSHKSSAWYATAENEKQTVKAGENRLLLVEMHTCLTFVLLSLHTQFLFAHEFKAPSCRWRKRYIGVIRFLLKGKQV